MKQIPHEYQDNSTDPINRENLLKSKGIHDLVEDISPVNKTTVEGPESGTYKGDQNANP